MGAHIFHQAEDRHADFLEHAQAFAGVEQGDVLRGGDDDGAGDRHFLRQGELNVAGAGGHVDDQIVQIVPAGVIQ